MISVKRIDKTLIVVIDGKVYNKVFENHEEVDEVQNLATQSPTPEEIAQIVATMTSFSSDEIAIRKEIEEKQEEYAKELTMFEMMKDIIENGHDILEVVDNSVYMKGIDISMPKTLVKLFTNTDIEDDYYQTLQNFWRLCALNPDPRARQDLFDFLKGGNLTITPNGYFVAYRNVALKEEGDKELNDAISREYLRVKEMKKGPKNYSIVLVDGEYKRATNSSVTDALSNKDLDIKDVVGNLYDLYHGPKTSGETVYTDNHTHTFTIKIGELVQMDRTKCDADPKRDCSYGLHVGNKAFLSRGSFGQEGLTVLVDPSKVIAVPEYNQNKMRVCEYLPIGIAEYDDEGQLIEIETAEFEYEYSEYTQTVLEEMVRANSSQFEEYKKQLMIPQELTVESLSTVVDLAEINELVNNRVQQLTFDY